jgi:hypothetical protein
MADTDRARNLYKELQRQLKDHAQFSGGHAGRFSNIYYLLRPATLVLAIVTTVASSLVTPKQPVITHKQNFGVPLTTALSAPIKGRVIFYCFSRTREQITSSAVGRLSGQTWCVLKYYARAA